MTNWYSVFYWLTVADGVKEFFDGSSDTFTFFTISSFIGYMICTGVVSSIASNYKTPEEKSDYIAAKIWLKGFKTAFITFIILCIITWAGYIFTPSKKDALIIIAGGAVGNFVTQDSSARAIPSEVMMLLRTKIKEDINETSLKEAIGINTDTLKDKSKEELIKLLKEKK